jgi:hypothetical protein
LEARGGRRHFAENPLRGGWAEVGWLLGQLGLGQEKERGREVGCAQGKGERGFLPIFLFLVFISLFKIQFQICFEFCLKLNFDREFIKHTWP